jgi:hypothetical protein
MRQLGRRSVGSLIINKEKRRTGILKPWGDWSRKDSAQRGRPAVPDHWTGRPGGSGAQPPLHLIYMVKVERPKASGNYDQVHLALVQLGFCGLVTTNYDEVLECAVREAFRTSDGPKTCAALDLCNGRTFNVLRFLRGLSNPSEHRYVLHLHGIHSAPNNIILTSLDYVDKYGQQIAYDDQGNPLGRSLDTIHRKVVWALLATHPLVFVGFSMEDAFFNYILKVVQADFQSGTAPIHFAIFGQKQGDDMNAKTDALRRNGVQAVYYPIPPPQGIGDSSGYSIGLRNLVFEIADKLGVSFGSPGSVELTKRMLEL